jgi:hypothetical protein
MTKRFALAVGVILLATNAAHAACITVNGVLTITSLFSLPDTWDPTPGFSYQSPICSKPAPKGQADKIQAAFALAPAPLQKDLCSLLMCIFVGAGKGSGSWGKWEDINQTVVGTNMGSGNSFIAIHNSDFDMRLDKKHDAYLKAVNNSISGLASHADHKPDQESKPLSLLYTLAHEMAHIKWRQAISIGQQKLSDNCTVIDFINSGSWSSTQGVETYRWIDLGTNRGQRNNGVKDPTTATTNQHLNDIYTKGMVTFVGDLNAAEDFVETYAIQSLMLAKATLDITITGYPNPISVTSNTRGDAGGDAILQSKFKCVLPLLTP